ncbi:MAG: AbrB/MazE/SpoVT family DNA-binding domain-containing protein [Desulfurella sp.]
MTSVNETSVKLDNKGRVTLPKNIRKALGLKAGTLFF